MRSRHDSVVLANHLREFPNAKGKTLRNTDGARNVRRKKQFFIREYRVSKGCTDCGIRHPAVLDLHHLERDTKHKRLKPFGKKRGSGKGWAYMSYADIEAEVHKCEVVCSNCHRIREYELKVFTLDKEAERLPD